MRLRLTGPLLAAALFLAPGARAAAAGRAVWVWESETYAMLEDKRVALEAIDFLKSKGIDTVYIYADAYKGRSHIEKKPKLYRTLIRRLGKRGIRAYALLGSWHLRTHEYVLPAKRREAIDMLGRVLAYNSSSKPAERFAGVNIDIEPHMLDAWETRRDELLGGFLDLGKALMAAKLKSGEAIPVGPAIPFWLDRIELEWDGKKKAVSEHIIDIFDTAVLMDYRNSAGGEDGMIVHAASELSYAEGTGKQLSIGIEVSPNEISKVTFNGRTEEYMEKELAAAEEVFSLSPAFEGLVIHHYEKYRAWLKGMAVKKAEER